MKSKKTDTDTSVEETLTDSVATEIQNEEYAQTLDETSEVDNLNAALTSAKDQNLRLYAEFENYKRRNAKERLELMASANLELMTAMLPVVDDFERALKNITRTTENESLFVGVELIYNKLIDSLKKKGLKPLESTVGLPFDVETMEAITRVPVADKKQNNLVLDEIERGYQLGNKMLRYARVIVAQTAETNA